MDFSALKGSNSLSTLREKSLEETKKYDDVDERIWKPTLDKAGNGSAVIRFLPAPPEEQLPWVKIWEHGFQGPTGKWYIEKSLTTLGQDDPVSEFNKELWDTNIKAKRNQASRQKRRLKYYSNIYVVSDPNCPENEGKVFLYQYGKKIFEKIDGCINPKFADDAPFDPFHLYKGANFKLRIYTDEVTIGEKKCKVPVYDESKFDNIGPLLEDDAELEKIWRSEYSLSDLISPDKFKSYEKLKDRFEFVMDVKPKNSKREDDDNDDEEIEQAVNSSVTKPEEYLDEEDDAALKAFEESSKASSKASSKTPAKPPIKEEKRVEAKKEAPKTDVLDSSDDEDIDAFFSSLGDN